MNRTTTNQREDGAHRGPVLALTGWDSEVQASAGDLGGKRQRNDRAAGREACSTKLSTATHRRNVAIPRLSISMPVWLC
jgi:hypothetical protein